MKKKIGELTDEEVKKICNKSNCRFCPLEEICDDCGNCKPRELAQYLDQEVEVEE